MTNNTPGEPNGLNTNEAAMDLYIVDLSGMDSGYEEMDASDRAFNTLSTRNLQTLTILIK
eukprot:GAHX01002715.1.p1 GENE.GAHX01002715.1~~GAHX01002715.1.p1  ORF type:complete len:60 (+),score=7.17 GAHX01002715.1:370-549(+)